MSSSMYAYYPWVSRPLIANAAMANFAGSRLAVAVTIAGGLGFIGSEGDMESLSSEFDKATSLVEGSQIDTTGLTLPIGVGFLIFLTELEGAANAIAKYRPAAILLSCPPEPQVFAVWSKEMRAASPQSRIWIQVPGVTAAVEAARLCVPDVLVLQAADAGGHGCSPGAGLVNLIPETRDALDAAGFPNISIVGAGGIGDGRGVAATMTCGADGVLLGTAFLASLEVDLPEKEYQEAVLEAVDGGKSTVRSTIFDELRGKSVWPGGYDCRALVSASYKNYLDGVGVEELRRRYADAVTSPHKGFGGERRAVIWAGSGVGLLKEVKAAGDIVRELREGCQVALDRAASRL
jgi:nitronate monooxygenase